MEDTLYEIASLRQLCRSEPTAMYASHTNAALREAEASPILVNLLMHYAFGTWMQRINPNCPFACYADDAAIHCRSWKQAEYVM